MQLRNKITFATGGIGVMLLLLGASGAWYVLQLQRSSSEMLDINVSGVRAAERMDLIVREMRHELDRFLLTRDVGHLVLALEKQSEAEAWLNKAKEISASENEEVLLAEIESGLQSLFSKLQNQVDKPNQPGAIKIVDELEEEILTKRVVVAADRYLELNEDELELSNQQSQAMAERLALALLLLGTCGAIAGLVVGYGLARGISRSIFQLSVPIRDVAGTLDEIVGPLEISADPSLTELETTLQTISANVASVVEQLHERHREVIRADQLSAIGQLAAGLAHEIRNPLMCMKTLVQSARRQGESARIDSQDLTVLDEEITRLESLLQSFLDFARPAKLDADKFNLSDITRQSVELVSSRAQTRNVSIGAKLPSEPLVIHGDSAQLRQVLLNLLLNALDAVQNGGEICVAANRDIVGQPMVRLLVSDNGRGLPTNERGRIYEPFFSTKETGLGLGLAISNQIVEAHGGTLTALMIAKAGVRFSKFNCRCILRTQSDDTFLHSRTWFCDAKGNSIMPTLLIVDDEPNLLYSLKRGFESDELNVVVAETAEQGIDAVREQSPDAVILDVRLPDMSGLDAFNEIRRIDARLPVIIITAFSTTETAIEAMKRGAYEYLLKPVEFDKLHAIVSSALEVSRMSHVPAMFDTAADANADPIIGRSQSMQEVYKAIGQVAPKNVNVLILGESGTGKEMVARAIYQHSQRNNGPFLAINCAALSESLLESELFGHERGSFTGAERRRIGKFEQVNGGTIFLDEIGDMTTATQSKVLRLLQEGTFERVGSNETVSVDVRVIAATNRNLETLVKEGKFREDLYYRLRVFTIELPPLRERADDVPCLVEHFIKLFNRELDKNVRSIAPDANEQLIEHAWPGNVRELENAIKHALVRCQGDVLTLDSLPASCLHPQTEQVEDSSSPLNVAVVRKYVQALLSENEAGIYASLHNEIDRILLPEVLNHAGGNQVQASELLGIARSTLRTKINDLGLEFEKRLKTDTD